MGKILGPLLLAIALMLGCELAGDKQQEPVVEKGPDILGKWSIAEQNGVTVTFDSLNGVLVMQDDRESEKGRYDLWKEVGGERYLMNLYKEDQKDVDEAMFLKIASTDTLIFTEVDDADDVYHFIRVK